MSRSPSTKRNKSVSSKRPIKKKWTRSLRVWSRESISYSSCVRSIERRSETTSRNLSPLGDRLKPARRWLKWKREQEAIFIN